MALNLSTLTSPSTSDDVLSEILTTADFLDSVPVLRNLAKGSNAGGDAKQTVALNQPKALPLIKNPAGNLGGYLYIPNVSGNYAEGPSVTIGSNETWEGELDMVVTQWGNYIAPMGGGDWTSGFGVLFYAGGDVRSCSKGVSGGQQPSGVTLGTPFNAKFGFDGTNQYVKINDSVVWSNTAVDQSSSITLPLRLSAFDNLVHQGNYAIQKAKLTVNSSVVFDCDFNGSTSIRHGDTKFQAAVGGPVTINQSGNDPATIIKKPVLRFDGVNSGFKGLLNQTTVTEGCYLFAAFSVLGDGGEQWGRVISFNPTGGEDYQNGGYTFVIKSDTTNNISLPTGTDTGMFDDANGDILVEAGRGTNYRKSRVNDASVKSQVVANTMSFDEFNLGASWNGSSSTSIDLEYLAVFPASISDKQADQIRNYINNRNNVFYRWDTDGYYFYNPQDLSSGAVTTWNGRIVGSDNGDADKNATQSTSADQPTSDGYKVTFADNTDHFDIPSTTQAGWQVVGTSLGTFAYRVNANAVTELNLLGNLGNASFRQAGDLYGIILLPASATGREIEEARKLLIDRGAADGTTASTVNVYFYGRGDIVEFKAISFSSSTSLRYTWHQMSSLASFPSLDLTNAVDVNNAWSYCALLSSFNTTEIPNCNNFISSWQGCSSLTQFPQDAKLGTEASNVNFSQAWRSSGLTSFSTPLPTATSLSNTWRDCSSLTSFSSTLPLATSVSNAWQDCTSLQSFNTELSLATSVQSAWSGCTSLTSFNTELPLVTNASFAWFICSSLTSFSTDLPSVTNAARAWQSCSSLTSFSSDLSSVVSAYAAWLGCSSLESFSTELPSVRDANQAWFNCTSLTDFSADVFSNWNPSSILSGVFNLTWDGCTSLTAQSVENILTSIDASGKYATSTGLSGGTALADAGIDIDYNGDPLSAATTAAITSLKSKGWSIFINSVEQ